MDEWDQEKLEAVVNQKHGTEKNRPTDIICKFFLDAVERKQYGWCASLPYLGRVSIWEPSTLVQRV